MGAAGTVRTISFGCLRRIVNAVRVPPSQYVVLTRMRCLVGRLTRRERIFVADLLEPHLRLRFVGSLVGSAETVRTVVVCFGFFAASAPAGAANARTASAAEARARCDMSERLLPGETCGVRARRRL